MIDRYINKQVLHDLNRKMVFIGGPRQVGKTTLATHLYPEKEFAYLNWDIEENRQVILSRELPVTPLLIFDEIHKYHRWRNYLKGIYDSIKMAPPPSQKILVTGSARLDYYRYGGDSLQGRYHYIRLLPLTIDELGVQTASALEDLMHYGGFPEPFTMQSAIEARRWTREYRTRLIREELRSLEQVQDLGTFELLMERLPELVGSPLSINAVREDLQVAHRTVSKWVDILERLYVLFRLAPMSGPKIRAVKKEQKHYHFDWTLVHDEGARFENLVAVHLLKQVYFLQDSQGRELDLRYFRNLDGKEVDFVILENRKPLAFIECKLGDQETSSALRYLMERNPNVRGYQIHLRGKKDYRTPEGLRVCSAHQFLSTELFEILAAPPLAGHR